MKFKSKLFGSKKKITLKSVFILVALTLGIVGVAAAQFGGISNPFAPKSQPSAGAVHPYTTKWFKDPFKDGEIDKINWGIGKTDGVTISENKNDLLRMKLDKGSQNDKARRGSLTFKTLIAKDKEFAIVSEVFEPKITGKGLGAAGVRFSAKTDKEAAILRWERGNGVNKLNFAIYKPDGKILKQFSTPVPAQTNKAVLKLVRVDNKYYAYYKIGANNPDISWKQVGQQLLSQGASGNLSIFATNVNRKKTAPEVAARFDNTSIGWDDGTAKKISYTFQDNFRNRKINLNKWRIYKTKGAYIRESSRKNLVMSVRSGATKGKRKVARVTHKEIIPKGKDFTAVTQLFRPKVTGKGMGVSGMAFASKGSENDESVSIRWYVSNDKSYVVYAVRTPDGKLVEKKSKDVSAQKITVRMRRIGEKNFLVYQPGNWNPDEQGILLGTETNPLLGSEGFVSLFTSNTGRDKKYPKIVSQFDMFRLTIKK